MVDGDYRGDVGVIVANLGTESYIIQPGDRIAQFKLALAPAIVWNQVAQLSETTRGEDGFGSTGN